MMSPAFADDVYNQLDATVDADAETMSLSVGGADGTTTLAVAPRNGDGKNGCNLNQNNGQTLIVAVTSSDPLVAIVTPATITLNSCGATPTVTVTPIGTGTAEVGLTELVNTTGATFDFAPAAFDVDVAAGNTAPTVTVSGVTDGSSYDKGSVPAAMCDVVDAEDGNTSFAATLGAITGTDAADGIGSQTASCDYTDGGGLTDSDSATYDIVDPSAPDVSYAFTPAAPDGANGWYVSDVAVDWTVGESDSPGSLLTTDCDDFTVNADQVASDYTCRTTSAGGTTDVTTATIQRDTTDPTLDFADGPAGGATYYFGLETVPAAPTCTADDTLSLVAPAGCDVSGWSDAIGSHTITSNVEDNAGNSTTITRDYDVVACTFATSMVGTVCEPKCAGVVATIKGGTSPIVGTLGDDVIVGTTGADEIDGLGGNDLICGLGGDDDLGGGDDDDTIHGGLGNDSIGGGGGDDLVFGGAGDDTVEAGSGSDDLRGGTGADTISAGAADADGDSLSGDGGDDLLVGGDGDDVLIGGTDADTLQGGLGADLLNGGLGNDDLQGGDDDDLLKGNGGDDVLDGGNGTDVLNGMDGLDTLNGGEGADTLAGGFHADVINGGGGNDLVNGGDGGDTLNGDAGNDTLNGNAGDDVINGGDDDDRLVGGPGADTLDGGAGTNVLIQ